MFLQGFRIFLITVLLCAVSQGQLATSLKLTKRQYLAGEPVMAVVTITNHAGQELTFFGDGRSQWLNFIIKNNQGEEVTNKGKANFGKMVIKPGESLAREVNLSQSFHLTEPGTFSAVAVVHMPGRTGEGSSSNRVMFNQSPGAPYWTQKVGIAGQPGKSREFRVLNFSGDEKSQIYAQVIDSYTGQNIRTFLLGDVLMLRKPLVTVDKSQNMHVMFLATPTMWVHYQIDTNGRVIQQQVHQRGAEGDPRLLTFADGSVSVANSIPYDQKAAAEAKAKVRKASDRPPVSY